MNEVESETSQADEDDSENRSEPLRLQNDHPTHVAVTPVQSSRAQEEDGDAPRDQGILQVLLARSPPRSVHDGDVGWTERLVGFYFLGDVTVPRWKVPLT